MKQRLLLALLMLLTSAGFLKAENNIVFKIPKASGTVTITMDGSFTDKSHPIVSSPTDKVVLDFTTTQTIVKVGEDKENEQVVDIEIGANTVTKINTTGKVTEFDASGVSASSVIGTALKSLEFVSNGVLTTLKLGSGGNYVFPNLETLSCSGNKLSFIPAKSNFKNMQDAGYKIGTQSPEGVAYKPTTSPTANQEKGIDLTLDLIKIGNAQLFYPVVKTAVSYSAWQVTDGKGFAKVDGTYSYKYKFYEASGSNIFAGESSYTCDLISSDANYPGVVIKGVKVDIAAATFTVKKEVPEKHGTIIVYSDNDAKTEVSGVVNKNAPLLFVLTPDKNYTVDKERVKTEGLTTPKWNGDHFTANVLGDVDPKVTAYFKGADCKIQYTASYPEGKVAVTYEGGAAIQTDTKVAYGTRIEIVPTATKEGYKVEKVQVNGIDLAQTNGKYIHEVTGDVTISVTWTNVTTKKIYWDKTVSSIFENPTVKSGATWNGAGYHEAASGKEVVFELKYKNGQSAQNTLKKVLVNGSSDGVKYTKSADDTYIISFIVPKIEGDVYVTIETTALSPVEITAEAKHEVIYNGQEQDMPYKISPELTDNISILYKQEDASENMFAKGKYKNVGTYDVKFARPADNVWQEATVIVNGKPQGTGNYAKLIIKAATPTIVTKPSVTVEKKEADGKTTYSYKVTPGKAQLNSNTPLTGEWVVVDNTSNVNGEGITEVKDEPKETKLVYVRFTAQIKDKEKDPNYAPTFVQVPATVTGSTLKSYKVTIAKLPVGTTLELFNGSSPVKSGESVLEGTTLTAIMSAEGYKDAQVAAVDDQGNKNNQIVVTEVEKAKKYTVTVDGDMMLGIVGTPSEYAKEIILNPDRPEQKVAYNGQPQYFDVNKSVLKIKDGNVLTTFNNAPSVSYFIAGTKVAAPIEVGVYTVIIEREAGGSYAPFKLEDKFEIIKADPAVADKTPKATEISIGQMLSQSQLIGEMPIEGSYQWVKDEKMTTAGTFTKAVKFVPADTKNYNEVTLKKAVEVTVSDKTLITFVTPVNGQITIVDSNNKEYVSGSVVKEGTKLTVTAIPNEGFEVKSFTVGSKSVSGNTYSFTFGKESISIVVEFKLKEVNPESVVITLPTVQPMGAILSKTGAQEVAFNGELTFSVATLAADKNKVSVTANGVSLKPNSNGVYTVKADKNKTVSVSVANPTAIVVKADTTLSPGLKPMGKVEIQGWTSTKKYYYGDVVTVTAFPESGVTFVGWKGFTDDSNPLEVILKEPSYTFKALYKGIPTGIEDIMAASIATGKGCVWVRGIANADVTIVSIAGRVQARQRISGDTRIDVPAGIYVVVLESGSDVKRVKVIVK